MGALLYPTVDIIDHHTGGLITGLILLCVSFGSFALPMPDVNLKDVKKDKSALFCKPTSHAKVTTIVNNKARGIFEA